MGSRHTSPYRLCQEDLGRIYLIHTYLIEDKRNLTRHTLGKKKATLIVIPSTRFNKLVIHHLQRRYRFHPRPDSPLHLPNKEPVLGYLKFSAKGTKREVFGMPIPGNLITTEIQEASYYQEYLAKVAHHRWYLASETGTPAKPQEKNRKKSTETSDKPPKAKKSKYGFIGKKRTLKSVAVSVAENAPVKEPQVAAEDANLQRAFEESMKSIYDVPRGPLPPVVAHGIPSLQKPKKKSPTDQYIFQRRTSTPTGSSDHDEPSYAELGQFESEEFKKVVPGADEGGQGQAGPDPGNAGADVQSIPSHVVHTGSDREYMDLDVADVSPQPSTEQMEERFTATTYLKVQENLKLTVEEHVLLEEPASSLGTLSSLQHLSKDISFGDLFFSDKPSDADNDKANVETKVESIITVTIQQDMSSIPPKMSPIIDLTSRPESPKVHQKFKATSTETTTTTTILPPPPSHQQSTTKAMMIKRIDELEHIMANLIQENKGLEERLDSHRSRLYTLKQLDIPHQVSEAVKLAQDLAEARKKKKKGRESPNTPPGSPPHQPLPPPPPARPSRASGAPGASGSSQVPPPPPPPSSTNQESQSKGSAALSSSKTAASFEYQAWTTTDLRLNPSISLTPADLEMDGDMVRTHMQILSVVRIEVFSMYGYDYMKKIDLRRADLNEHVIVERDFKYLYPSDFEDTYLLNLQGHLNHLPPKDKKILTTATQLNLTKPHWDATRFEYKHDYTVIDSPRAVMFRDKYGVQMMMRFNDIHKFSDGMLEQIDEALDYRVKEFMINRMNLGLNMRFWTRKDVDQSKTFMFAIQKRLKTRRIFRNLESFVGGRVREGDYRLLKRTE
nr:E-beta-farnesene synthase [Tanacetum cinerariifolium]